MIAVSTTPHRAAVTLAAACVLLVSAWFASPVAGQQGPQPGVDNPLAGASSENVGERAAAIIGRINENVRLHRSYQERLAVASPEDSLVLRLQMEQGRDAFIEALRDLAAAAPTAEQAADSTGYPGLRTRVAALLPIVTPKIWERIAELRREIDALRARRQTTPGARVLELEGRIDHLNGRVDMLWQYGLEHLRLLEAFALESPVERDDVLQQLRDRADELEGRLDLSVQRMTMLKAANKEAPGDTDLKFSMAATKLALDSDARSLGVTLDIMERLNLPTTEARGKLIAVTRDLASGLLEPAVGATLAREALQDLETWSGTHIRKYAVKLLVIVIILALGRLLSGLVRKVVDKSLRQGRFNLSELLRRTLVSAAQAGVFVIAVVVALLQLGISLGPMLAGLGVAGFIVGFALQDSLSNFAAGMMILIYRPFDVGDQVEVVGILGKVQHMSMVSTTILTFDNQKLVVPNNKIWGDVIKNVTDQNIRRVDMTFGISYSDDIVRAETVLADILERSERVLKQPEPVVRLHRLGESSVDFVVRPWVKTEDYWDVYWEVTRAVKVRFDEERITIPFPQRDVNVRAVPGGEAGSPA